ncbi:hypothetical protein L218DRAFT_937112 [Marasmius fiardii PR-910]|nr:hypothetical protein L218DRAFT_937112 [Marasmius fiardii PR-910]
MLINTELIRRTTEIRRYFRSAANKSVISQFLADIEVEKNRIQAEMYTLKSKRDQLTTTANLYRSLLSPIHAMPSDILSTIFAFCCQENVLLPSSLPPVLRLSMVCGRWRDIALSTPSLWSSIGINLGAWSGKIHMLEHLTKQFMERSQQSPLHLSLVLHFKTVSDVAEAKHALDIIIQNCERWKDMSLDFEGLKFSFPSFASIHGRLPVLRSLSLTPPKGHTDLNVISRLFDTCPSLRALEFFTLPDEFEPLHLPWNQLKLLRIHNSFINVASPLLTSCKSIERLEFTNVGGLSEGSEGFSDHSVTSSVKSLIISMTEGETQHELDDILQHVTLKGLESLEISMEGPDPDVWSTWDGVHMHDFLRRSSCRLTSLRLHVPFTDRQTLSLLQMIPTLCIEEYPEESNCIVTDDFLNRIVADTSLAPILPNLNQLKLKIHQQGVSYHSLLKMLSSRWNGATDNGVECLRSVEIIVFVGSEDLEETPFDGLCCFRDTGMRLSITYQ